MICGLCGDAHKDRQCPIAKRALAEERRPQRKPKRYYPPEPMAYRVVDELVDWSELGWA